MRTTLLLLLTVATAGAQNLPHPVIVNPEHRGMPYDSAFDVDSSGRARFVWSAYRDHQERLYSTVLTNGRRAPTLEMGPGEGVYWSPLLLAHGDQAWTVWQQQIGLEWRIYARRLVGEEWSGAERLSAAGRSTLTPAAEVHEGELYVAWEDHATAEERIVLRSPDGEERTVSQPDRACYRPELSSTPEGLWALWDCYGGLEYSVYARQVEPSMGPIAKLSGARNATDATATYGDDAGLTAVWVTENDVLGKGALDQHHKVETAVFQNGSWTAPREIADLAHSLLSTVDPEVGPIWGFAGRRLHPMLIEDSGAVWMLWERKVSHAGNSTLPGELNGRRFDGRNWSEPVKLHEGLVLYDVPGSAPMHEGILTIAGFDSRHNLHVLEIEPAVDAEEFQPTELTGWERVTLPLDGWVDGERPAIEIDGVEHRLYWGDLHVHTTLTADAEGEVDELMHFARDKARLDVVVMQENDASSWLDANPQGAYRNQMLTDSEYALSVYFSRRYTEPGRFVALAGWEWSDRTDDGNANHRTAIFAGDHTPLIRHSEEDDFQALCDQVEAAGGVMNSQHPTFRLVDRPCDANIEVAAGWGVYINRPEKIHADLTAGFKVGFVGTSDGHRRNPGTGGGLTGFWLPELTSQAALDALRDHRVFATNGSRVMMDARANGGFMGTDVETDGEVRLTFAVQAPRPIRRAVLVRDGDEIYAHEGDGQKLEAERVDMPGPGFHWYYWRVEMEGDSPDYPGNIKAAEGHLAWTSPHRVTVR